MTISPIPSRPELGVHLREAAPLVEAIKEVFISDHELLNPEEALPPEGQVTVYISNHGPMFAPLPAPALTVDYLLHKGGYEDLVAVTLFHNLIRLMPGVPVLLNRYFGNSTRALNSLPGLIEIMKEGRFDIIGTSPEGVSCILSYDEPVGAFTKVGLIIAALESGSNLVLTAQKGVEVFGLPLKMPLDMRLPLWDGPRGLLLPFWHPWLRAHVRIKYRRYEPLLTARERATLGKEQRRSQLDQELRRVRRQLTELYSSIP